MKKPGLKITNPFRFFFSKEAAEGYVPNRDLLAHAAGLTGQNMTYSFVSSWWFMFCNDILGIDAEHVGWFTASLRLWDAVNDPIIGSFVDRRRFKSGEKLRPYLLYMPPFIGILSVLMFINFRVSAPLTVAIMLICYFFWDFTYSFQDVALWGMIAVSSPHSEERARVSQWVSIGAGAGGAIVSLFPLLKGENVLGALGIGEEKMYLFGALFFGLGGMLISMLAYKQKERICHANEKQESLKDIFRGLVQNRTLLIIALARFLQQVTPVLDQAHFFESSVSFDFAGMHIDGGTAQLIYGLLTGIPGTLCMFAATKIVKKLGGKKQLLVLSQILAIAIRIIAYFVGFSSLWQIAVVITLMAVVQIPGNMMDIAHRSLLTDSIDYVEWKTGVRNEGITFSVQNFVSKMQSSVSSLIKGYILTLLRYDNSQEIKKSEQNKTYLKWQWPIFILGPVIGSVMYLITILFLKDDKETKERVERELRERRQTQKKHA